MAAKPKDSPEKLIAAGRLAAGKKAPYMKGLMVSLVPISKPGLGTVSVSEHAEFFYDPEFVGVGNPEETAFMLGHECLHLWLGFFARVGNLDPGDFNKAQDFVINVMLRAMGFVAPTGDRAPIFPTDKDYGFPEGLTTNEYYDLLQKKKQQQPQQSKGNGRLLGGACGSCAGNPNKDAEGDGSAKGKNGHGEGGGGKDDDHSNPGSGVGASGVGRTEAQIGRILKAAAEAARDSNKGRGTLPLGLQRLIDLTLRPPTIPWREELRTVVRSGVMFRPGAGVMRYDAPSKRQAGLGFGIGKAILPRFRDTTPRVVFGVDTSGSMGKEELEDVIPEVRGVMAETGSRMRMIACDAEVHVNEEITSVEEMVKRLKGGGGTDFRPVFKAIEKLRAHERPNVLVFYTDGFGPAPECAPDWCKVIWLLTKNGRKPCDWGTFVRVGVDKRIEEDAA
jgi:predicted metal-dependent peptidase